MYEEARIFQREHLCPQILRKIWMAKKDIVITSKNGPERRKKRKEEKLQEPSLNESATIIQLPKMLYDMFGDHPQEQDLYRSIAKVGSLLFEIGEVGKQFYKKKSPLGTDSESGRTDDEPPAHQARKHETVKETTKEDGNVGGNGSGDNSEAAQNMASMQISDSASCSSTASTPRHRARRNPFGDPLDDESPSHHGRPDSLTGSLTALDAHWEITFKQFLASTLTEPSLVDFFEQRPDVISAINGYRQRRTFQRQLSEISMTQLPSQ